MDAFTTPVNATITPWVAEETKDEIIARQTKEIDEIKTQLDATSRSNEYARNQLNELRTKIKNVEGLLRDYYDMNGEITEELIEIATLLDIALTKTYNVTWTVEFSGTVQMPIDMDPDDVEGEVSFSFDSGYSDAEFDLEDNVTNFEIDEAY